MRKIRSWQDLADVSSYREAVNPGRVEIAEFLCHYGLDQPFEHCGIAGCSRPHRDGHLIRLQDGTVTSVGSCCGQRLKNFGVKLDHWQRKTRRIEMIRRIGNEKERIIQNAAPIAELLAIHCTLRSRLRSFSARFPASYAALRQRFCKDDRLVLKDPARNVDAAGEGAVPEAWTKREPLQHGTGILGQLVGMSIFGPPASARLAELKSFIAEMESTSPLPALSDHRLSEIELCIDFFDSQLAAARAQILDSQKFFCAHNYQLIARDGTLPGKERRLLQADGCDAFISGNFGASAKPHVAVEGRVKQPRQRAVGHAQRGAGRSRSASAIARKLEPSAKH